ncbi:MAG TPA: Glu/Leu/Phe/Val dehydrogenase dimerization domain-containing protein [Longimicrobiaceae bacterium]|nr:Glu/Leu/Phe/Val dehydrogenase dimerization domain-containing protein [Longimicrobiaceae bacterium]
MNPVAVPSAPSRTRRAPAAAWSRYTEYLRRPPLLVVEWADDETEARGWLVINSFRGGAAGGGTRMRRGLTRREVTYLAKTMELKFALSGPFIGGAKSGIDFDPTDPRREGVLRRWFRAVAPYLRHCYGTGGDLNVDQVRDVIPCLAELEISHPQEGIVRGHRGSGPDDLAAILETLTRGLEAPVCGELGIPGRPLPLADLVTGYGVARSILHQYALQGRPIRGARVLVEGFGAVGAPCALYLAQAGARVVGISDREKALLAPEGMGAEEVEALLRARDDDKLLPREDPRCTPDRARLGEVPADVFVAAAVSGSLDEAALERLAGQGVEMIACGANQPFREAGLGSTRVQRAADRRFTVVPDVISNCGMARAYSYLMEEGADPATASVFRAVDATIAEALREVSERAGGRPTGLLGATWGLALDRVALRQSL